MSLRSLGGLCVLLHTALCAGGCTSESHKGAHGKDAGNLDAPDELPPIRLTLGPVTNFSSGAVIADATVCIARARPIGETAWTDFVDPGVPCVHHTTPLAGASDSGDLAEVIVFETAPAMSELIVTGEREGFRSAAWAVTTGATPEDLTVNYAFTGSGMALYPESEAWSDVEFANPDPMLGDIRFQLFACTGLTTCAPLDGATVSLTEIGGGAAGTPLYVGGDASASTRTETATGADARTRFINVSEGEYLLSVDRPGAECRVDGWLLGDANRGFAAGPNEVRVPVLGKYSVSVAQQCFCDAQFHVDAGAAQSELDPSTCTLRDGGAHD